MKKITSLFIGLILICSCVTGSGGITLTTATSLSESVAISLPQTNGTALNYNETVSQNLNDVITNYLDVTALEINSFSYRYANFTGNANAVLQSATIKVNNITIATLSNVNVSNEATANNSFTINDQNLFDQLEALFLSQNTVDISFSGTAISDEGVASFDVVVDMNLTVTISSD